MAGIWRQPPELGGIDYQLKTLAKLYNDVEEGKSTIVEISVNHPEHEVTTMGSIHPNYIKSGVETVTMVIRRTV